MAEYGLKLAVNWGKTTTICPKLNEGIKKEIEKCKLVNLISSNYKPDTLTLIVLKYLAIIEGYPSISDDKIIMFILDYDSSGKSQTKDIIRDLSKYHKNFILEILSSNMTVDNKKKLDKIVDIAEIIYKRKKKSKACKKIATNIDKCNIPNETFERGDCIIKIEKLFKIISEHKVFKENLNIKNIPIEQNNRKIKRNNVPSLNTQNNTPPQLNNKYNSFSQNIKKLKTLNKNSDEYKSLINKIRKDNPQLNSIVRSEINKLRKECKYVPGFKSTCSPNISLLQSILPKKNNTQNVKQSNKEVIKEQSIFSRFLSPLRRKFSSPIPIRPQ